MISANVSNASVLEEASDAESNYIPSSQPTPAAIPPLLLPIFIDLSEDDSDVETVDGNNAEEIDFSSSDDEYMAMAAANGGDEQPLPANPVHSTPEKPTEHSPESREMLVKFMSLRKRMQLIAEAEEASPNDLRQAYINLNFSQWLKSYDTPVLGANDKGCQTYASDIYEALTPPPLPVENEAPNAPVYNTLKLRRSRRLRARRVQMFKCLCQCLCIQCTACEVNADI